MGRVMRYRAKTLRDAGLPCENTLGSSYTVDVPHWVMGILQALPPHRGPRKFSEDLNGGGSVDWQGLLILTKERPDLVARVQLGESAEQLLYPWRTQRLYFKDPHGAWRRRKE